MAFWRPLIVSVIVISAVAVGVAITGTIRAATYGSSLSITAFELVLGGILAGIVSPFVLTIAKPRRQRSVVALVIICALAPLVVVEAWFRIEEVAFRREALRVAAVHYDRPRWWPFGSFGVVYSEGKYDAHD